MLRSPFHFTFISGFSMKLIRMAMREGLTPLIINDSMPSVWSNLSNACEQCLYAQPFHYYFLPHHIHCNLSMQLPGRGGHRTYFVGVGTTHNIYRKHLAVGGLVGGGWSKPENNATLWLHLASWNLPDSQLS